MQYVLMEILDFWSTLQTPHRPKSGKNSKILIFNAFMPFLSNFRETRCILNMFKREKSVVQEAFMKNQMQFFNGKSLKPQPNWQIPIFSIFHVFMQRLASFRKNFVEKNVENPKRIRCPTGVSGETNAVFF